MGFVVSAVLAVCLISVTYGFKLPEDLTAPKLTEFRSTCITESGIDPKMVDELEKQYKDGDFTKQLSPEIMKAWDDKEPRCYTKCMAIKMGMISDKGDIMYDNISKMFEMPPDHECFKAMKECEEKNKQEDLCERIANIKWCMAKIKHP